MNERLGQKAYHSYGVHLLGDCLAIKISSLSGLWGINKNLMLEIVSIIIGKLIK